MKSSPQNAVKALFVSHENLLAPGGGGNQICSREYRDVLVEAGFDLHFVTHQTDRCLATRLERKLLPHRYPRVVPREFYRLLRQQSCDLEPKFVFCNFTTYLPDAEQLKAAVPAGAKLILLSHGLTSVDDVHRERIALERSGGVDLRAIGPRMVGGAILTEMKGLPFFDHVFCLAEFEVAICQWLGARSVSWWPRTIPQDCGLDWRPAGDRIGLVGTLSHPPNLEGVYKFCRALAERGGRVPRLRLVTKSAPVAAELSRRYDFVDHLGSLEGPGELEAEAATWSAYTHPIFCFARGCSTKLATGIAWGLPVLTTAAGIRGYTWREGQLLVAPDAEEMAVLACRFLESSFAAAARVGTLKVRETSPTHPEVSRMFRDALSGLS
jgi:hypothetical protein